VSAQPAPEEGDEAPDAEVTETPEAEVVDAPESDVSEPQQRVWSRVGKQSVVPYKEPHYPEDERGIGMPGNPETDLDEAFPGRGSVLPSIPPPRPYFEFKESLYERIGLKLAFNYSMLAWGASSAKPAGEGLSQGKQTAWAGILQVETQWVLYQREKDYPGSLVVVFDWRHAFQDAAEPAFWLLDTGSMWAHDFIFLNWGPWFPTLYYEQVFKKDVFVLRVGQFASALQFIDFFRFKDSRTSFSGSTQTLPGHIIPFAPPGFGIQFDLRPFKRDELYISGIIHDQNGVPDKYSWNEFFTKGDHFYGLEIGHFWKRSPRDFDHVHVNVAYSAAADQESPAAFALGVGNEPGWLFKAHGSKQINRWVVFGNYTFNTTEGGPQGATNSDHSVTAGVAFLRPLDINGEWAFGTSWARHIAGLGNQYGIETYWKILFAEDLWVTPNLQLIFNPLFNTTKTVLAVGGIKLRLFF
ncbi:MAG: carbohydrate porin, partial [Deltaproteobacteria bacterium]|nr:carbohydrate porin [Deltaproteobacteria bacterium]